MKKFIIGMMIGWGIGFLSCSSQATKAPPVSEAVEAETPLIPSDAGKVLAVQVKAENIRREPNGEKLGQLSRGDSITVIRRVGNWVQFNHRKFKNAYIWAPSVGYTYQNLYSPYFYFDTTLQAFREIAFFQNEFSQRGQRRQETPGAYELFFKDLGLGSHESIILDVVTESQQLVEHGITLFVNKSSQKIEKLRVDYFKPVQGFENALKKSELPVVEPAEINGGHLIWPEGKLVPHLIIDLERKEWESNWFSGIWYILETKP